MEESTNKTGYDSGADFTWGSCLCLMYRTPQELSDALNGYGRNGLRLALEKHLKELHCLYDVSRITGRPGLTLKERLAELVEIIPPALQYPGIAFARISLDEDEYKTDRYRDTPYKISAAIMVNGVKTGFVETGYSKKPPSAGREVFSKEEKLLLNAIAERIGSITEYHRAEDALRESEEKFATAFQSSPAVIIIADLDTGRLLEVNDNFAHLTGYTRQEALKLTTIDTGIWSNADERNLALRDLKTKGHIRNMEVTIRHRKGAIRYGLISAGIVNIGGRPCVLTVITDITEQQQSQELAQSISRSSSLGIYIIQDEKIVYINPQFQSITGYDEAELLGKKLLNLVFEGDRDVVRASAIYTLQQASPYPCEFRILHKSGHIKWVVQTVSHIHYQGKKAVLGNLMDITERKFLERKLIEYEEVNKTKNDLLATVSHELRTPLTGIKGYATMILDHFSRLSTSEMRETIEAIDNSADRLAKLIDNLLDTTRIDAGLLTLKKTPADITDLIREAAEEASLLARNHHIVMKLGKSLPRVYIDIKRIHQVLDNLIDNAFKYSLPGTVITISAREVKNELLISVADRGRGIPPSELTSIFERMYKIEQRQATGESGIGLGLHVCQRLIEAHGGRIWAESTMGKGSTFKFTLPLPNRAIIRGKRNIKENDGKAITVKTG